MPLGMIGFPSSGKSSMAADMVMKCLMNRQYKVSYKKKVKVKVILIKR